MNRYGVVLHVPASHISEIEGTLAPSPRLRCSLHGLSKDMLLDTGAPEQKPKKVTKRLETSNTRNLAMTDESLSDSDQISPSDKGFETEHYSAHEIEKLVNAPTQNVVVASKPHSRVQTTLGMAYLQPKKMVKPGTKNTNIIDASTHKQWGTELSL